MFISLKTGDCNTKIYLYWILVFLELFESMTGVHFYEAHCIM